MPSSAESLEARTERFALNVCRLIQHFPQSEPALTIKRQLAKCSTSVAANYRASRRSRSHAEFTSRIAVVAEEADESCYWLRLTLQLTLGDTASVETYLREARELTAIFSAMVGTARRKENAKRARAGSERD